MSNADHLLSLIEPWFDGFTEKMVNDLARRLPLLTQQTNARPAVARIARIEENDTGFKKGILDCCERAPARISRTTLDVFDAHLGNARRSRQFGLLPSE